MVRRFTPTSWATGASTADLAIILIDARYGVQTQTKRHSFIAKLLGIKHIIVAINKMDLVAFSEEIYDKIVQEYLNFAQELGLNSQINLLPLSTLSGDNVVKKSEKTSLTQGKRYFIKRGSSLNVGSIDKFYYKTNVNTLQKQEITSLHLNEIAYDPYNLNKAMGSFIIIDRVTNNTVGAGMIVKI